MMNRLIIPNPVRWKSEKTEKSRVDIKNTHKGQLGRASFVVSNPQCTCVSGREAQIEVGGVR